MKKYFSFTAVIIILLFAGCESSTETDNTEESGYYFGKVYNWNKGAGYKAKYIYHNTRDLEAVSFPIDEEGVFEMTFPDTLPAASLLEMTEYLDFPDTLLYGWESYNFKIMYGSFALAKDGEELGPLFHYQKNGDTIISPQQYAELVYSNKEATIRGVESLEHEIGRRNVELNLKLYKGWNKIVKTIIRTDTVLYESYNNGSTNLFNLFYYGN